MISLLLAPSVTLAATGRAPTTVDDICCELTDGHCIGGSEFCVLIVSGVGGYDLICYEGGFVGCD